MNNKFVVTLIFFLFVCCVFSNEIECDTQPVNESVFVIPLHGEVDFALASFAGRSTKEASEQHAGIILFDIDTFGGRVDSALEISHAITDLTDVHTIGYISVKAISAGALIALSCDEIIMKRNTTLGDCAPIAMTNEGPEMLGEKFQSPLRAEFRKLANANGYPTVLSEAMVSADICVVKVIFNDGSYRFMNKHEYDEMTQEEKESVYKINTIVDAGKLLTLHAEEALDLGFATDVVDSIDDVWTKLNVSPQSVHKIEFMWSEIFVRFLDRIAPILMLLGLLGIYMEFKVPGFGLPGIVGIVCFGLVFGSKFFVGLATYSEIVLFLIGLVLLILEIFVIPGFGIAGIMGILCIVTSLYLASQPFVIPELPWQIDLAKDWIRSFLLTIVAFIILAVILAKILPHTWIGKRIILSTSISARCNNTDAKSNTPAPCSDMIGKTGVTLSILRPTGRAQIEGRLLDVITEGCFIAPNTPIRIIRVEGSKLIVEEDSEKT